MKKTKIILLAIFIAVGIFGFGVFEKTTASNECGVVINNFDASPKNVSPSEKITILGSMTGTWGPRNNAVIFCDILGSTQNVSKFVVAVYDNISKGEMFYMEFPIGGNNTVFKQDYIFPSRSFIPKDMGIKGASMQLEAHVKIFSQDGKTSKVLAVSAPVNISVKQSQPSVPATTSNTQAPASAATPEGGDNKDVDCTDPNKCLYNPLPTDNLTNMILLIMQGFLAIIAIWAVAFIIVGGFRFVMSQGNEEAVTAARKTITWAVVGLIIALMSFSIIAIVKNIFKVDTKKVGISRQSQTVL